MTATWVRHKLTRVCDHARTGGLRSVIAIVATRGSDHCVTRSQRLLKAAWARVMGMRIGRNAQIDWSATITGCTRILAGENLVLCGRSHLKSMVNRAGTEDPNILIGNNVFINEGVIVDANYRVSIGDNTMIGPYSVIIDSNHIFENVTLSIADQGCRYAPVTIGRDCWIGAHAVILPGVTIGDHAVVAANSTVARSVPARAVVAGTPARIIKNLDA